MPSYPSIVVAKTREKRGKKLKKLVDEDNAGDSEKVTKVKVKRKKDKKNPVST